MFQSAPAITGGRSGVCPCRCCWHQWFQSAPAITGGRSDGISIDVYPSISFNPRPPSLAGDPSTTGTSAATTGVSIRARHHWRAIRQQQHQPQQQSEFQSAPAITGGRSLDDRNLSSNHRSFNPRPPSLAGDPPAAAPAAAAERVSIRARHHWRAIRREQRRGDGDPQVSIRARHHWRAILPRSRAMALMWPFQSAPAITGGRSAMVVGGSYLNPVFQSAPAITGGRSIIKEAERPAHAVSIRARHHWRAIQAGLNSNPSTHGVSIRARHHWRAIPQGPESQALGYCRFNPRPPSLAGDPATRMCCVLHVRSFNPRPPSLAGDPRVCAIGHIVLIVSIRARHHWRAIRRKWCRENVAHVVSIRARHHWRAIPPMRASMPMISAGFNPRPPSLAGDPSTPCHDTHTQQVSIRARHHWRAIPWRGPFWGGLIKFQSAPAITGGRSIRDFARLTLQVRFQSAPAITGGRSNWLAAAKSCVMSFNPRPPSLAGDPSALRYW